MYYLGPRLAAITARDLPLDGGGWEGVLGATICIVANLSAPREGNLPDQRHHVP